MTIGNAMDFIKRGLGDRELRERLNAAPSIGRRDKILSNEGLPFTQHEFEEAHRNMLISCTEMEAADQLKEFKSWWELLAYSLEPGTCTGACAGCSS